MGISEIGVGQDVSGIRQRVLYAIEASSYGVPPLTTGTAYTGANLDTTKFNPIGMLQGDVQFSLDNQLMEVTEAGRINVRDILEKAVNVTVSNVEYYPKEFSFALACIGDYDSTSPITDITGLYQHKGGIYDSTSTYESPVEYEAKSFSLNIGLAGEGKAILFTGCKAEGITINLNMDEPLKVSVDTITARKPYLLTGANVDLSARYVHKNWAPFMYHAGGEFQLDGTTLGNVTELTVSIKNNLTPVFGMIRSSDKRLLTSLLQGQRSVSGTMTINYKDEEFIKYLLSSAADPTTPSESGVKKFDAYILVDNRENGGYTTGVKNTNYRGLRIDLKDIKLGSVERSYPKDGKQVSETYNFNAKGVFLSDWDQTATDSW